MTVRDNEVTSEDAITPVGVRLLTVPEVAAILRVRPNRVYELVRERLLPAVHLGRQVRIEDLALRRFISAGGQMLPGGWRADAA